MMSSPRSSALTVPCFVLLLTPLGSAQLRGQISAGGVGPFHLCDTLARVSSVFPSARDTTPAEAERSSAVSSALSSLSGIAKVVRLTREEWVLFETESVDSVYFLVDDSSAHAFWRRYDSRMPDSAAAKLLSRNARVKELLIASPCED